MRKTHGYRKLAMALALVFVTGLALAACSSSSSSVDDALSHPGEGLQGTFKITLDPSGDPINISQPDMAASVSVAEGVQVWTCPAGVSCEPGTGTGEWDGVDTTTGDIYFKWKDTATRLENLSFELYDADTEGQDAYLNEDDICGGDTISACADNPGYFYVAETAADDPETEIEYDPSGSPRASRYLRAMPPKTSVKVPWSVVETSGNKYNMYGMIMADKVAATTANDDSRYDTDTATFTIQAYDFDHTDAKNPDILTNSPITSVAEGQWFYTVVWVDYPGANSTTASGQGLCADGGNNDGGCNVDETAASYDYYFTESEDNFTQESYVNLRDWPSYCSYYNTGFTFLGGGYFEMRWDPSVLTTNDSIVDSDESFTTSEGTTLRAYYDADLGDQLGISIATTSNTFNRAVVVTTASYDCSPGSDPIVTPPMPDGKSDGYGDPTISGNWVQGDYAPARIALKPLAGTTGQGSRMAMANNGNTSVYVGIGKKSTSGGSCAAYACAVTETSPNYPMWSDNTGTNTGQGDRVGAYNERMGYVEIQ